MTRATGTLPDSLHWQRRATQTLAAILRVHADLDPIAWQIEPHGCHLTGLIIGSDGVVVERRFAEWATALRLRVVEQDPDLLRAISSRCAVDCRINLIALPPRKDPT
ncbi:hypothetical protein MF672_010690 [Actinomadura sp. ATCC 31491]|uniref:Uncharacterized protein n=1 Tax=Actinomadura luzonensis TaxID=2805427 RepID=A0ABT0FPH5_9ACTN|nr:hypothetical protein [Actinomadura luzonensis]MCK2214253.1 hypothetical protein [Actinomadura luzonensis]